MKTKNKQCKKRLEQNVMNNNVKNLIKNSSESQPVQIIDKKQQNEDMKNEITDMEESSFEISTIPTIGIANLQ